MRAKADTEASACGGPARARVAREESAEVEQPNRARNRDRTDDLILTKDVLYRLSYASETHCRGRTEPSAMVKRVCDSLKTYLDRHTGSSLPSVRVTRGSSASTGPPTWRGARNPVEGRAIMPASSLCRRGT